MMKKATWLMIAMFLCHDFYPLGIAYGQEKKETAKKEDLPYIGVLDLEAKEGVPTSAVAPLSDSLRKEFFNSKKFKVLDRKNMDVILKEQGFQQVGCTSSECAVEAGRLLGVEKMVTGNIAKLGDTHYISITVTNVETGEVESIGDEKCRGEIEQLFDAIERIVGRITGVAPKETAPAIATATTTTVTAPTLPNILKITGEPADSRILVDGSVLGSSPQEIEINPGPHKIEITRDGYKPFTKEFQAEKDRSYGVNYTLEKISGAPEEKQIGEAEKPKGDIGCGISFAPRFALGEGSILSVGMRLQPRIYKFLWVFADGFYSVYGNLDDLKALAPDETEVAIEVDNSPKKSYMISSGIVIAFPPLERGEISFEVGYDYSSTAFEFTMPAPVTGGEDITDSISAKGSGHHEAVNLSYYSSGSSAITLTAGYIKLPVLPKESEDFKIRLADETGFSGLLLELRIGFFW